MGRQIHNEVFYLETTSLNLSATGIGCFLDDILHETIGLKTNQYQTLYHFTVGRGLADKRLIIPLTNDQVTH